jgi:hypothetical protein
MSRLEDLQPDASVQGILPNCLVTVGATQWFGSEALELTYKDPGGKVANELLYRHHEPRIDVAQGRPWSFDGRGVESVCRVRLDSAALTSVNCFEGSKCFLENLRVARHPLSYKPGLENRNGKINPKQLVYQLDAPGYLRTHLE